VTADDFLDPKMALFVGVFVAALFWFAAVLVYVAAGGLVPAVTGLATALAGLGGVFLLAAVVFYAVAGRGE
jgi:hypothetical protein